MQFQPHSLATQRSRIKGLGAAKSGTGHFWHQRVSAVALIPLTIFFIGTLICLAGADHAKAVAILKNPFVGILIICFILAGVYHMRLGMQVIIEDYVHEELPKILLLAFNTFFAIGVGVACAFAILKLSFGA